jgi:hypothetical protein
MRERRTSWWPRLPRRHGSRRRSQRGAVAVEAAIITPLFCILVFGIIEFGLVFKDYLAVTSSVRAGARIASAEPRNINFAQDAANQVAREGGALNMSKVKELWVYKADLATTVTNGAPLGGAGTFNNCTTCVKFTWNGTAFVPKTGSPGWLASTQNACSGDALHDRVGVYLVIDHPSITGLIFNSLSLASHTVISIEPLPSTAPCK